jgi:2-oxoisovalerate dehydrogenase E2 component (dihydrolipoyl transacylase)
MTDTVIRMPKLADTLVEGTVGKWLRQVGESVAAGEPLVSIETDKVTTDLTSPAAGAVLELLVREGQTVAVETPIARIGQPLPLGEVDAQRRVKEHPRPTGPHPPPSAEPSPTGRRQAPPKTTPVAARLLAEHGLVASDLGGARRVTKADVLRYLELRSRAPNAEQRAAVSVEPETLPGNVVPLSGMRRAIAEHMSRARKTIPMGQTVLQADLTDLATWREREKAAFEQREGAALTYTVVFVHALAQALKTRQQHAAGTVDIGVAVALDAGLIVPVIRGADALSLAETARALNDLANRARSGRLQPGETHGALMTVTNVGSFGNLFASPIVPLEQIGIFGPGIVERRPMPTPDGGIRIGWRCWLTLMFDRRAFDDLAADRFLRSVLELLLQVPQDAHRG